jgi:FAD synthetase
MEGMVRVIATGVFDILHPGHLHYLEAAKALGDELVVIVATDKTVHERKHHPITPEDMRVIMVQGLKPVDKAVLGHEEDPYEIIVELKPDIITIGFDQKHDASKIQDELAERGLDIQVVRLEHFDADLNGTRKIIRKIADRLVENYISGGEK